MKYFPISTKTACQLKWTWSTVFLNDGTTASCHRVGRHSVSVENFENFHNTPEKLDQRKTMLRGEWPQPLSYMHEDLGCRYCQKIEESGGQSDRQYHLQIPDLVPPELDDDPEAIKVTPRILEVFLTNTCNLACTYCNSKNSSVIENENKKFGRFEKNGLILSDAAIDRDTNRRYIQLFFSWLEKNHQHLRRLHLLGGEPFYQKEFYECVDFFKQHPNPNLEFNIVTNLMVDPDKFQRVVDDWKQIISKRYLKRFDITVSLDCWGQDQEYARHGLKLDVIEKNMQVLLDNKWIYLNINSTLSPLTIRSFHLLIEKINQWRLIRKINHHFQTVFDPQYHNPSIFGPNFWDEDFEKALSKMPHQSWQEQNNQKYLKGIWQQIQNSCTNPNLIVQFYTHLDELDRRRGTNWREIFPYLER